VIDDQWAEVLAELEQRLTAAEAGLSVGLVEVAPFAPPDGLGPLPAPYEAWATALLLRTRALETALQETTSAVGRQLATARRQASPAAPVRPAFFDAAV
jgi:hypothetical protein